jgi:pimeloyl-ACP methyl ester carboxylesterase
LAARGGRLLPKLIGRVAAKPQGATLMNRLAGEITRLPPDVLLRVRAHWSRPEGFQEMAETLESLPACAQDAASLALPPDLPCTIISAGNATPSEVEEREAWLRTLKRGRHIRLERGAHWIQLEHPAVVVDEVRRLLDS